MFGLDRSESYERLGVDRLDDDYKVTRIRERSLGARGSLYEVPIPPGYTGDMRLRCEDMLKRYADVHHAHLPLLADAWGDDRQINFVLLHADCTPLSLTGNNPVMMLGGAERWHLIVESLHYLAALHDLEIVHNHLVEAAFGTDRRGFLHLCDPGLADSLAAVLTDSAASQFLRSGYELSSNIKKYDVADWANMICSLQTGQKFVQSHYDDWDASDMQKASAKLVAIYGERSMRADFFVRCLRGRAVEGTSFASAREALDFLGENSGGPGA